MSKRAQIRAKQLARKKRQRMTMVGVVIVLAAIVAGAIIWQSSKPIGEIVSVDDKSPSYANGKSLGSVDAPVVIQDFSNFT